MEIYHRVKCKWLLSTKLEILIFVFIVLLVHHFFYVSRGKYIKYLEMFEGRLKIYDVAIILIYLLAPYVIFFEIIA